MSTSTKHVWTIDPVHSDVQFKVKHMVISTITGSFHTYDGKIETDGDDFENAKATFTADIGSVSTNNEQRDQHLKSDDFFNAEKYPKLSFESTSVTKTGENEYDVTGNLTLRDVTQEVKLHAVHGGTVEGLSGDTKAGFEVTGTINRKEFGLNWSGKTKAGNVVAGDDVKLQLDVQFAKG